MLYVLGLSLGGLLVCCSGSPVMAWMGLELVTLGMLGVVLRGGHYPDALKYLVPNAVAGAAFLMGSLGDIGALLVGGLLLKLGLFPLYFWVAPVASALGPTLGLWSFLGPAKVGPVWLLGWLLDRGVAPLFLFVAAAAVGSALGAVRDSWWVKLSLTSTGIGGWAVMGGLAAWWLPTAFMVLYGICLLTLLGLGAPTPGPGGASLLQLLVVAGLPPGGVFWAKAMVVGGLVSAGVAGWATLALLALSEIVSWGVYLSIAASAWMGTAWVRWPVYEAAMVMGPLFVVCGVFI